MTEPESNSGTDRTAFRVEGGVANSPVCVMDPLDITTDSFTLGPQRLYVLRHPPTGTSASTKVQDGEPLTDGLRAELLHRLSIEVLSKTMTEAQWLRCPDARPLLLFLKGRATRRKLRLFACAMCRRSLYLLVGLDGPTLLRQAEDATDEGGNATTIRLPIEELRDYAAQHSINARGREAQRGEVEASHLLQSCRDPVHPFSQTEWSAAWHNAMLARNPFLWNNPNSEEGGPNEQLAAIRDIFGNPFRSVAFDPSWLTSPVVSLAQGSYADRAFDRLPILANALEESGCNDADILTHCRGSGPHYRGCWVVDSLLGKE